MIHEAWGPPAFLVPALSSSNRYALVRTDALSLMFEDARLKLDMKPDTRLNAAWFGSLAFELGDPGSDVLTLTFRGFVSKTPGSRTVIVVSAGGELLVREDAYGTSVQEDVLLETTVALGSPQPGHVTVTVLLLAERQSVADVIDLEANAVDIGPLRSPAIFSPD